MGMSSGLVFLALFVVGVAVCGCTGSTPLALLLALSSVVVALVLYSVLTRAPRVSISGRAVLITGCDSGFGFLLARRLDGMGVRVLAGCLQPDGEGARKLASQSSARLTVLPLDVTSDEQVQEVLAAVTRMGLHTDLWAIVNNAGIGQMGEVEMCNMNMYQRVANVNLWGTIRITMAFLPLIKVTKGRIINISSILARLPSAIASCYCITKSSLEMFSNCLRLEMKKWDVKVICILPGSFLNQTKIMQNISPKSVHNNLTESQKAKYTVEYIDTYWEEAREKGAFKSRDAGLVIDAITEALTASEPSTHYLVCSFLERALLFLLNTLPTTWTDYIYMSSTFEKKRRSILAKYAAQSK